MKDNSSNHNRIRFAQAATGMSPADFPLGSTESRAAARMILDHSERSKPRRSQYDQDALHILHFDHFFLCSLEAQAVSREVRATAIYQHGEQLDREPSDYSEPMRWDKDPDDRLAEILQSGGIELPPRDVKWRNALVRLLIGQAMLAGFESAWKRQLPEMPFPIRVERDGDTFHMYRRPPSGEWTEETHNFMILEPARELKELLEQDQIST
jgi:hypothetical protein